MWHLPETEEGIRKQSIRELLPKITPFFWRYRQYLLAAFGLLLIIAASQLIGPKIIQYIIDNIIDGSKPPASEMTIQERVVAILLAAGGYLGVALAGTLVGYIQAITLFKLGISIVTELKNDLFSKCLRLGLDFHESHSPGKLLSRVESDTETLKELFSNVALNLLRNILVFVGILVILCVESMRLAAWILLLLPVLFAATFWFITYMRKFWREVRAQWAILMGYVTEYVQGTEVIQMYNYEERARKRMHEVNLGKYKVEVPAQFLDYGFWGAFMFGEIIAIVCVLVIGVRGVYDGTVTIGTLVMFLLYISMLFQPIMQLSEQLNFIQRSFISIERVFGILESKLAIEDGPRPTDELTFDREIRFEDVWFSYDQPDANGEHNWILRGVSFTLRKGQRLALVGASGHGKSTIVNLMLRFYDPQRGRILVDGQDIREFPTDAWRQRIGLVLQDIFLFPGSVQDNIRVFDEAIPLSRVQEVAAIAKADTLVERLPEKYAGELAERGANLSVGERQLLSFARALAYDPQILVLDEATSSVDPHTERLVQEALDRLLTGRTAVIVAHRLSTIQNADCILLIKDGQIAEQGRHEELLAHDGLYAMLHRLQFGMLAEVVA
jgi:ATP-binding cassette, subfamily B, multidrug efflux pump